ncbi:MAG TPA: hypothetical protein VHB48_16660 [Chitinophagaceae bacterium]|nr:hypothetical protein [Chitinophagaceae bacterium]
MQHTSDDMDELFRSAADGYPLKIKGADWDSIAARLTGDSDNTLSPVVVLPASKSNKNYRYLLLLLLIPAGLLTAKYEGWFGTNAPASQSPAATATQATQQAPANTTVSKPGDNTQASGNSNNSAAPANDRAAVTQPAATIAARGSINKISRGTASIAVTGTGIVKSDNNAMPGLGDLRQAEQEKKLENDLSKYQSSTVSQQANTPRQEQLNSVEPNSAALVSGSNPQQQQSNNDGISKKTEVGSMPAEGAQPVPGDKGNTDGPHTVSSSVHHFYAGVFVAPDYTTIKYQPGNKVGFDLGGLVGYTLSKSLSVELGISLDKKYYTTDGRYYKSTEKWFQNSGKLLTLSGYSSLTEFPLNLRYNFRQDKNKIGNFFISGGLVSYIVHSENYNYEFDKDGYIYYRDKSTKKSTSTMFANLNISAGYSSSLGNNVNFRIEPYYRIPINGIGLGGLPITSIGLNIGIVKKFK